jgi:hypothetical protein
MSQQSKMVLAELKAFPIYCSGDVYSNDADIQNISHETSYQLFYIFHPAHVDRRSNVNIFRLHENEKFSDYCDCRYVSSTEQRRYDSICHFGEEILGIVVPTEAAVHSHGAKAKAAGDHNEKKVHRIY